MKLSGVRRSGPLVFMFLCATFSPIHPKANGLSSKTDPLSIPLAIGPRAVINTPYTHVEIQPLGAGDIVAGAISAPSRDPSTASDCLLGDTQYWINFPGGARK